ncbi:hypothetical protein ACW9UR_18205 [Halovulum sp. GXIMD14794]
MKRLLLTLALAALSLGQPALAQGPCYADYKAKKDNPLRLHYGVAELPPRACGDAAAAERVLSRRLDREGWTLLTVLSTFGAEGLDKRKQDAGDNFLRY